MSETRTDDGTKIREHHLQRAAYIYVRQSSLRQVRDHKESQRRQYGRAEWAVEQGWAKQRIVVVDDDQGKTAAAPNARPGFSRMVAAVARGDVGCVVSLEGARLARNGPDWAQLVFLCRWTDTLIADEHGVYDLSDTSDRMVLGIRGEINQLELDTSIQRMVEATWSKARRGELVRIPTAGYEIDDLDRLVCSPDEAVVEAVRCVFAKFDELGSARQVWTWLVDQKMKFPVRCLTKRSNPIEWRAPRRRHVLNVLHNPIYAGAYVFGRSKTERGLDPDDSSKLRVRRKFVSDWKAWPVLIQDHHFAYISWQRWLEIQEQLRNNSMMPCDDKGHRGAAREGRALLQGMMRCGHCGRSMYVNTGGSRQGAKARTPQYRCTGAHAVGIGKDCQTVGARRVDSFAVEAFLAATAPAAAEVAVRIEEAALQQQETSRRVWEVQLEKAEYEAQRAQRQYDAVEPENRLVARTLERAWNEALEALETLRAQAAEAVRPHPPLGIEELHLVAELAEDLPAIWDAPTTTNRDRKQLLRCLIEEVQLRTEPDHHRVKIVWKGGSSSERTLSRRRGNCTHATSEDTIELVRKLAAALDDRQIAVVLNKHGRRTGMGNPFTKPRVASLRVTHSIGACPPRPAPDPVSGPFTADEAADELGLSPGTIHRWLRDGLLAGHQLTAGAPWSIHLTEEVRQRLTVGDAPAGWVGLTEAARRLGVSKQLVAHRVNTGKLPARRTQVGKRTVWRIDVSSATADRQPDIFDPMNNENSSGA